MNDNLLKPFREILIVDDAFDVRIMLKEILKSLSITQVDEASSKDDLYTKLEHFNYRLVFLDIELSAKKTDENGLSALKYIKANFPNVRVIIISAHHTAENVRQAIVSGADGFVVKPFSIRKITDIIFKYCPSASLRDKAHDGE
ncbi:response regulator [Pleionea litopenaei]|uniref:Response regulator n=1 Tax=Pleionea litopenaei TaxID=3070815 RepID=A0AA51RRJ2_9GAMM|nr:response regulator [Pleionea sp. HL-JVS1]WMS86237.1 response regulator [Pleionea sp. HL-JVS1]